MSVKSGAWGLLLLLSLTGCALTGSSLPVTDCTALNDAGFNPAPGQGIFFSCATPSNGVPQEVARYQLRLPLVLKPSPVSHLIGAGDIAVCDNPGSELTAQLLDRLSGDVFTAGDNSNEQGTPEQFAFCFDPSWGRHVDRIHPAPGNHDYKTDYAAGYFGYFGPAAGPSLQGWYSYELNGWHILSLNSNCERIGGCGPGSPQYEWLLNELAAHPEGCTLAYWHHPLFTSGEHGPSVDVAPLWDVLYAVGAEVVINGHDHHYERFAPQSPAGVLDEAYGVRQFIVGTGGALLRELPGDRMANSQAAVIGYHGVLRLGLYVDGYSWQFITAPDGLVLDEGRAECH
ncbi:MAG TPA: metallophosphoesterase [Anaerolineaceae bacterium]|jgi:hypothetical protein|nr:metallophosphoesterase [Anaerolineaceae bacterium]